MKRFFIVLGFVLLIVAAGFQIALKSFANTTMANPWVDCEADFDCARKVSGINFQPRLSNYWIRAMKGMVEVSYPFDEIRSVSVRKTEKYFGADISGVYTKYKTNKKMKLKNGQEISIRANGKKIYVMNMATNTGYYSAYCPEGMSKREVEGVCEVIWDAQMRQANKNNKYSNCEVRSLTGKDVKRIKYYNYYVDYHSKKFKKAQVLQFAKECLNDSVSNQYEMDCCMIKKMHPRRYY